MNLNSTKIKIKQMEKKTLFKGFLLPVYISIFQIYYQKLMDTFFLYQSPISIVVKNRTVKNAQ